MQSDLSDTFLTLSRHDPTVETLVDCLGHPIENIREAAVLEIQSLCSADTVNQITSALLRLLNAEVGDSPEEAQSLR